MNFTSSGDPTEQAYQERVQASSSQTRTTQARYSPVGRPRSAPSLHASQEKPLERPQLSYLRHKDACRVSRASGQTRRRIIDPAFPSQAMHLFHQDISLFMQVQGTDAYVF